MGRGKEEKRENSKRISAVGLLLRVPQESLGCGLSAAEFLAADLLESLSSRTK